MTFQSFVRGAQPSSNSPEPTAAEDIWRPTALNLLSELLGPEASRLLQLGRGTTSTISRHGPRGAGLQIKFDVQSVSGKSTGVICAFMPYGSGGQGSPTLYLSYEMCGRTRTGNLEVATILDEALRGTVDAPEGVFASFIRRSNDLAQQERARESRLKRKAEREYVEQSASIALDLMTGIFGPEALNLQLVEPKFYPRQNASNLNTGVVLYDVLSAGGNDTGVTCMLRSSAPPLGADTLRHEVSFYLARRDALDDYEYKLGMRMQPLEVARYIDLASEKDSEPEDAPAAE